MTVSSTIQSLKAQLAALTTAGGTHKDQSEK